MHETLKRVISELDNNIFTDIIKMLLKGETCKSTAKKCNVDVDKVQWIYRDYLKLN